MFTDFIIKKYGGVQMKKMLLLIMCSFLLTACNNVRVGVIGGADGPTNIIVSENKLGELEEQIEKKSVRMFNVDGELYYDLGIKSEIDARCGTLSGMLKKAVNENEIPKKSGEANFDVDGYQNVTDITKEVCVDGEWIVFKKYDNQPEDLKAYKYSFYLRDVETDNKIIVLTDDRNIDFSKVFESLLSSQRVFNTDATVSFNIIK